MKAVFRPGIMALTQISRPRFKNLSAHPTCLCFGLFCKCFGDFCVYLGRNSFFSKDQQNLTKIENFEDLVNLKLEIGRCTLTKQFSTNLGALSGAFNCLVVFHNLLFLVP